MKISSFSRYLLNLGRKSPVISIYSDVILLLFSEEQKFNSHISLISDLLGLFALLVCSWLLFTDFCFFL